MNKVKFSIFTFNRKDTFSRECLGMHVTVISKFSIKCFVVGLKKSPWNIWSIWYILFAFYFCYFLLWFWYKISNVCSPNHLKFQLVNSKITKYLSYLVNVAIYVTVDFFFNMVVSISSCVNGADVNILKPTVKSKWNNACPALHTLANNGLLELH